MPDTKIVLPELAIICQNIIDTGRICKSYSYIEYNGKVDELIIKMRGMVRLNEKLEGSGHVEIIKNHCSFIYFGTWINGEMTIYSFVNEFCAINRDKLIFAGREYDEKYIISDIGFNSHIIFTDDSLNKIDKYTIHIPILHGGDLQLEMLDGMFVIDIDNAKPDDKFVVTSNLSVNALTSKLLTTDDETLYHLYLIIRKDRVIYERKDLYGDRGNFIFNYNLKKEAIYFLENELYKLPKYPKSITELEKYLH
jgi:hypothetical protein